MSEEEFNDLDFMGLTNPVCPSCGEEVSDVHNGGDPRAWWGADNMPDGHLKHECENCGVWFRIDVNWSPSFDVVPRSHDTEYDDEDFNALAEA